MHYTLSVGVPPPFLVRGDVYFWGSLMGACLIVSVPIAVFYNFFLGSLCRRFYHRRDKVTVTAGDGRAACIPENIRAGMRNRRRWYAYFLDQERLMEGVGLQSVLTCPQCGFTQCENMSTDTCQYFYQCRQCQTMLRPKAGDCCVFCSYGSVPCPPVQAARLLPRR